MKLRIMMLVSHSTRLSKNLSPIVIAIKNNKFDSSGIKTIKILSKVDVLIKFLAN